MNFKNNHFLHFLIAMFVIGMMAVTLFYRQSFIAQESRNSNRLASARLIVIALDNYQDNFQKYPEKLEEITDFLSPVPTDPQTEKLFSYQKTEKGFILIIPQEKAEDLRFQR